MPAGIPIIKVWHGPNISDCGEIVNYEYATLVLDNFSGSTAFCNAEQLYRSRICGYFVSFCLCM